MIVGNGVDKPTRLLRFVTFVHLPFSVESFDLFCPFTCVYEGHSMLCNKGRFIIYGDDRVG